MRYSEIFGCVIQEGYNMISLVADRCGAGCYHAIIFRQKPQDYVFCTCYDVTDGTWGQGHYCKTYAGALDCMCEYLK